ncbi:MAG: hypothetical protein LBK27_02490 [Treponema sp.]|jgi:hypothetical protein|nr:hypothetical protein [Treponema sp.]
MKKHIAAVLFCGVLMAVNGGLAAEEPPADLAEEEPSIDAPVELPAEEPPANVPADLAVEEPPADVPADLAEEEPPADVPAPKLPLLPTGSPADLAGEEPPPAALPLPPLPTGFSLELFGGGTPFFAGDFDWAQGPEGDFVGFESLAYAFGAGLTWFPPDYHNPYGFTMMFQYHFPTSVAWSFEGERYHTQRNYPGNLTGAAEFSLGYIRRIMVSPTGRFILPISVSLRAYYLGLKANQDPDAIHYRKLNLGFNGTWTAEWHFSPHFYLLGRYTVSIDVFSLASRKIVTSTRSFYDFTERVYYIDDRKKQGFAFYAAHGFTLGMGFKLKSLFGKKDGTEVPAEE